MLFYQLKTRYDFYILQRTPRIDFSLNPYAEANFEYYDRRVTNEIQKKNPDFEEFFKLLAICHTVMPEEKEG